MNPPTEYAKSDDVATKDDFQVVRYQLIAEIKKYNVHILSTFVKKSGYQWKSVMEALYNDLTGMLRVYKKPCTHRNFRLFIEQVFKKVANGLTFIQTAGMDVPSDIVKMNSIGETFFKKQE